jgi:hypothetical protein
LGTSNLEARNIRLVSSIPSIIEESKCISENSMSFSELENDTLNQSELNEIKINENNQIFEVSGQNENPRRRALIWPRILTSIYFFYCYVLLSLVISIVFTSIYYMCTDICAISFSKTTIHEHN